MLTAFVIQMWDGPPSKDIPSGQAVIRDLLEQCRELERRIRLGGKVARDRARRGASRKSPRAKDTTAAAQEEKRDEGVKTSTSKNQSPLASIKAGMSHLKAKLANVFRKVTPSADKGNA